MVYSKIAGVGAYLPPEVLTNTHLERTMDTSDDWITTRTGIKERHIAQINETPAFMAEKAAKQALSNAQVSPNDVELIIVATCTPEYFFPSTACLLQAQLGIKRCIAFDISVACTGFIYALDIADHYIRSGSVNRALIVGTEAVSKLVDWQDRNTCVLFGDGAGAVILEKSKMPGILDSELCADGSAKDLLMASTCLYHDKHPFIQMKGRDVFKLAVIHLTEAVQLLLTNHRIAVSDISWIIPHQANARIIHAVAERLGISENQLILTVDKHANTSSASIPLALHEGVQQDLIKRGQILLFAAFGGGLTWGSNLLIY